MTLYQEPRYAQSYTFKAALFAVANPEKVYINPTIDVGEAQIRTDLGPWQNMDNKPAGVSGRPDIDLTLSPLEMTGSNISIWLSDVDNEWADLFLTIQPRPTSVVLSGVLTSATANNFADTTIVGGVDGMWTNTYVRILTSFGYLIRKVSFYQNAGNLFQVTPNFPASAIPSIGDTYEIINGATEDIGMIAGQALPDEVNGTIATSFTKFYDVASPAQDLNDIGNLKQIIGTALSETTTGLLANNLSTFYNNEDNATTKKVDDVGTGVGGGTNASVKVVATGSTLNSGQSQNGTTWSDTTIEAGTWDISAVGGVIDAELIFDAAAALDTWEGRFYGIVAQLSNQQSSSIAVDIWDYTAGAGAGAWAGLNLTEFFPSGSMRKAQIQVPEPTANYTNSTGECRLRFYGTALQSQSNRLFQIGLVEAVFMDPNAEVITDESIAIAVNDELDTRHGIGNYRGNLVQTRYVESYTLGEYDVTISQPLTSATYLEAVYLYFYSIAPDGTSTFSSITAYNPATRVITLRDLPSQAMFDGDECAFFFLSINVSEWMYQNLAAGALVDANVKGWNDAVIADPLAKDTDIVSNGPIATDGSGNASANVEMWKGLNADDLLTLINFFTANQALDTTLGKLDTVITAENAGSSPPLATGNATSGTTSSLTDTSLSLATDIWKGHHIRIVSSNEKKLITGNSATVITFEPPVLFGISIDPYEILSNGPVNTQMWDDDILANASINVIDSDFLGILTPSQSDLPATGTKDFKIVVYARDGDQDPIPIYDDSLGNLGVLFTAEDFAGNDMVGNIGTVSNPATGRYEANYTMTSTDQASEIIFTAKARLRDINGDVKTTSPSETIIKLAPTDVTVRDILPSALIKFVDADSTSVTPDANSVAALSKATTVLSVGTGPTAGALEITVDANRIEIDKVVAKLPTNADTLIAGGEDTTDPSNALKPKDLAGVLTHGGSPPWTTGTAAGAISRMALLAPDSFLIPTTVNTTFIVRVTVFDSDQAPVDVDGGIGGLTWTAIDLKDGSDESASWAGPATNPAVGTYERLFNVIVGAAPIDIVFNANGDITSIDGTATRFTDSEVTKIANVAGAVTVDNMAISALKQFVEVSTTLSEGDVNAASVANLSRSTGSGGSVQVGGFDQTALTELVDTPSGSATPDATSVAALSKATSVTTVDDGAKDSDMQAVVTSTGNVEGKLPSNAAKIAGEGNAAKNLDALPTAVQIRSEMETASGKLDNVEQSTSSLPNVTVTDIQTQALAKYAAVDTGEVAAVTGSVAELSQGAAGGPGGSVQVGGFDLPALQELVQTDTTLSAAASQSVADLSKATSVTTVDDGAKEVNATANKDAIIAYGGANPWTQGAGGGSGQTQPRQNKPAGVAFRLKISARNDGTHRATKPIRLRPGGVVAVATSLDMAPLFGAEHVTSVGVPTVVPSGGVTATELGPRDTEAMVILGGSAVAGAAYTVSVPVTMDTGEIIQAVFDVEVFAD